MILYDMQSGVFRNESLSRAEQNIRRLVEYLRSGEKGERCRVESRSESESESKSDRVPTTKRKITHNVRRPSPPLDANQQ